MKKNEGFAYHSWLGKRKKIHPKCELGELDRTAVLKETFRKSDKTSWGFELYEITEVITDTIPNYRIDNLSGRYNEALLKKTELTMKENIDVMKKLNIT